MKNHGMLNERFYYIKDFTNEILELVKGLDH